MIIIVLRSNRSIGLIILKTYHCMIKHDFEVSSSILDLNRRNDPLKRNPMTGLSCFNQTRLSPCRHSLNKLSQCLRRWHSFKTTMVGRLVFAISLSVDSELTAWGQSCLSKLVTSVFQFNVLSTDAATRMKKKHFSILFSPINIPNTLCEKFNNK